jgi:hypothetical protein
VNNGELEFTMEPGASFVQASAHPIWYFAALCRPPRPHLSQACVPSTGYYRTGRRSAWRILVGGQFREQVSLGPGAAWPGRPFVLTSSPLIGCYLTRYSSPFETVSGVLSLFSQSARASLQFPLQDFHGTPGRPPLNQEPQTFSSTDAHLRAAQEFREAHHCR